VSTARRFLTERFVRSSVQQRDDVSYERVKCFAASRPLGPLPQPLPLSAAQRCSSVCYIPDCDIHQALHSVTPC